MDKPKFRFNFRKIIRWTLWVLLIQFILVNISAALYAYRFRHVYDMPAGETRSSSGNIFSKTWRIFSGPRQFRSAISSFPSFKYSTVKLKTRNEILIDTWYALPDSNAKGTVILFHGIMGNKGMLLPEATQFHEYGYNVMLVDLRAHGNSQGHTTSIGAKESEEVKLAYDHVTQQGEKNIFLYGVSMGAVVVAKAIADYDLQPTGIFLDMPFASLQSHLRARARGLGFTRFGEKPFGFFVTLWTGIEGGFNGFSKKTTSYVAKIKCPVLMQWGAADTYVLKSETDKIYKAIASTKKKLVIYGQAGHESLQLNDPVQWQMEVERFLADCNTPH